AASVSWIHDVFGNSIAITSFAESAAELQIERKLQTYVVERPRSEIAPEAARTICLVLAAIPEVADIVLAAGGPCVPAASPLKGAPITYIGWNSDNDCS